ncbi:MAG: 50S ribosomal protein L11 [Candidatus Doudnabacteria bacterium]|nr:50S ribosomal protein L11 [Candidatus Doudnabacteria bacterium]
MAKPASKGKKELKALLTLQIPAGKATPAPPLGPILGQNGVPIPKFCEEFNAATRDKGSDVLPVKLSVFTDGSFTFIVKQPTVVSMIKKAANVEKGSGHPKKDKVGKIRKAQVREIAERKLPDLNTKNIESAMRTVEGSARSLGIEVIN